jgi:hypothetical protein
MVRTGNKDSVARALRCHGSLNPCASGSSSRGGAGQ